VLGEIQAGRLALHSLCAILRAKEVRVPARMAAQLRNINTPQELARARRAIDSTVRNAQPG
jgi:hypothetical protein